MTNFPQSIQAQPTRNLSPITELTTPGSHRSPLPELTDEPPPSLNIDYTPEGDSHYDETNNDDASVYSNESTQTVTAAQALAEGPPVAPQAPSPPRLRTIFSGTPFPGSPPVPPRSPAREGVFSPPSPLHAPHIPPTPPYPHSPTRPLPVIPGGLPPPPRPLHRTPSKRRLRDEVAKPIPPMIQRSGLEPASASPVEYSLDSPVVAVAIKRNLSTGDVSGTGESSGLAGVGAGGRSRPGSTRSRPSSFHAASPDKLYNTLLSPSPKPSPSPVAPKLTVTTAGRQLDDPSLHNIPIFAFPPSGSPGSANSRSASMRDLRDLHKTLSRSNSPSSRRNSLHAVPSAQASSEALPGMAEPSSAVLTGPAEPAAGTSEQRLLGPVPALVRHASEGSSSKRSKRSRKDSNRRSLVPNIFLALFTSTKPSEDERAPAQIHERTVRRLSRRRRQDSAPASPKTKSRSKPNSPTSPRARTQSAVVSTTADDSIGSPRRTPPRTAIRTSGTFGIQDDGSDTFRSPKSSNVSPSPARPALERKSLSDMGSPSSVQLKRHLVVQNSHHSDMPDPSPAAHPPQFYINSSPSDEESSFSAPQRAEQRVSLQPVSDDQGIASPISPLAISGHATPTELPPPGAAVSPAASAPGSRQSSPSKSPRPLPRPPSLASATDVAQGRPSPFSSPNSASPPPALAPRRDHASAASPTPIRAAPDASDPEHSAEETRPTQSQPGQSTHQTASSDNAGPNLPLFIASHLLSTHAAELMRQSASMRQASENMSRMAQESLQWGGVLMGMTQQQQPRTGSDRPLDETERPRSRAQTAPPPGADRDSLFAFPAVPEQMQESLNGTSPPFPVGAYPLPMPGLPSMSFPGYASAFAPFFPSANASPQSTTVHPPAAHPFSAAATPSARTGGSSDTYTAVPPRPSETREWRRAERQRKAESLPAGWPRQRRDSGWSSSAEGYGHAVPTEWLDQADRLGREGWASLRRAEEAWVGAMDGLRQLFDSRGSTSGPSSTGHGHGQGQLRSHGHGYGYGYPDDVPEDDEDAEDEDEDETPRPTRPTSQVHSARTARLPPRDSGQRDSRTPPTFHVPAPPAQAPMSADEGYTDAQLSIEPPPPLPRQRTPSSVRRPDTSTAPAERYMPFVHPRAARSEVSLYAQDAAGVTRPPSRVTVAHTGQGRTGSQRRKLVKTKRASSLTVSEKTAIHTPPPLPVSLPLGRVKDERGTDETVTVMVPIPEKAGRVLGAQPTAIGHGRAQVQEVRGKRHWWSRSRRLSIV